MFCSYPTQNTSAHQHHVISCEYPGLLVKHSARLCPFRFNLSSLAFPQKLLRPGNIPFFFTSTSDSLEIMYFALLGEVPNQSKNSEGHNQYQYHQSHCFVAYALISTSQNPISICYSVYQSIQLSHQIGLVINI